MCDFDCNDAKNGDDVKAVAQALIDECLEHHIGDFTPYFWCLYCDAELKGYHVQAADFKHELGCPVLKAQDILTP